jgi:DNA-binding MarR family transcriptional regulator
MATHPPASGVPPAWTHPSRHGAELALEIFPSVLMLAAGTLVQRNIIRPMLELHGLSVAEWRVLISLSLYGAATAAEVVGRSFMDKAQVSRAAAALEAQKCIRRQQDPLHAKRWIMHVTAKGRRLFKRAHAQARQEQIALLELLSPEERRVMYAGLQKIIRHAQAVAPSVDTATLEA